MTSNSTITNGFGSISHPSMPPLIPHLSKYPLQDASLIQSWFDLNHSSGWSELQLVDIDLKVSDKDQIHTNQRSRNEQNPRSGWVGIRGRRKDSRPKDPPEVVIPCGLDEMLTIADFTLIFERLDQLFPDNPSTSNTSENSNVDSKPEPTKSILLAILSADSTIVYYKLSRGLIKPVN